MDMVTNVLFVGKKKLILIVILLRIHIFSMVALIVEDLLHQKLIMIDGIDDSFKKVIVVHDSTLPWHNDKGYLIINILDFLLNPNSLEL